MSRSAPTCIRAPQAIICLPSDGSWCVSDRSRLPGNYTTLLIALIGGAIVVLRGNKQFMVRFVFLNAYDKLRAFEA
jgi:hypothetical protein